MTHSAKEGTIKTLYPSVMGEKCDRAGFVLDCCDHAGRVN